MKVIIDMPQDHKRVIDNLVSDGKEYLLPQEVETRLARAVKIGVVIPDNATNGDMIKIMFPNCEVFEHKVKTNSQGEIVVGYDVFLYAYHPNKSDAGLGFGIRVFFDNMWWNAPYKKEVEE